MESFVQTSGISNWIFIPELLAWGFGIVLAAMMLRRGGGKAEKLFLAGCCLLFFAALLSPFGQMVMQQLRQSALSNQEIAWRYSLMTGLPATVLTLGALVCLIWGFWLRFRVKREAAA